MFRKKIKKIRRDVFKDDKDDKNEIIKKQLNAIEDILTLLCDKLNVELVVEYESTDELVITGFAIEERTFDLDGNSRA